MKKFLRGPALYLVIFLAVILLSEVIIGMTNSTKQELQYTEFLQMVKEEKVQAVDVVGRDVFVLLKDTKIEAKSFPGKFDGFFYTDSVEGLKSDMIKSLAGDRNPELLTMNDIPIKFNAYPKPEPPWYTVFLPYLVMILLFGGFWYFIMQHQGGGGGKVMQFGKSKAKPANLEGHKKVTFADVAGADEEKQELEEVVDFLKNPKKYVELGARIPKGILLVGPPGTGKTLLAKATAGEAGVQFFAISGSDFVEMFVGVGASRVRDLFENAKKQSPCIVFIDEIDAVGRRRGAGLGGGHDEREQTLNQLLVEMDGFMENEAIIVIAATNRADILDPALLRPGRFDRQVMVGYPDVKGREEILKVHSKNKPLQEDVDLKKIAKATPHFTGADLENLLNEASILAARYNKSAISMKEVDESVMRVIAGPEKKSLVVTEKDKLLTAYHEIGHAIISKRLPNCDPVHEVSIIPRGMAAGYTVTLPDNDDHHVMKTKLLDQLVMLLGGRAAEDVILGDISTGASSDLKRANEIIRGMITQYGMSEELGLLVYGSDDHQVFLGMDYGQEKGYSEEIAAKIDRESKKMITTAYERAKQIIRDDRAIMDKIVEVLLEKEKIDGKEFNSFFEE